MPSGIFYSLTRLALPIPEISLSSHNGVTMISDGRKRSLATTIGSTGAHASSLVGPASHGAPDDALRPSIFEAPGRPRWISKLSLADRRSHDGCAEWPRFAGRLAEPGNDRNNVALGWVRYFPGAAT